MKNQALNNQEWRYITIQVLTKMHLLERNYEFKALGLHDAYDQRGNKVDTRSYRKKLEVVYEQRSNSPDREPCTTEQGFDAMDVQYWLEWCKSSLGFLEPKFSINRRDTEWFVQAYDDTVRFLGLVENQREYIIKKYKRDNGGTQTTTAHYLITALKVAKRSHDKNGHIPFDFITIDNMKYWRDQCFRWLPEEVRNEYRDQIDCDREIKRAFIIMVDGPDVSVIAGKDGAYDAAHINPKLVRETSFKDDDLVGQSLFEGSPIGIKESGKIGYIYKKGNRTLYIRPSMVSGISLRSIDGRDFMFNNSEVTPGMISTHKMCILFTRFGGTNMHQIPILNSEVPPVKRLWNTTQSTFI